MLEAQKLKEEAVHHSSLFQSQMAELREKEQRIAAVSKISSERERERSRERQSCDVM